jgi:hypothetical protein
MTMFSVPAFNEGGRLRGSFVYMLMCQDAEPIYIKIGMSDAPMRRLNELRTACAVTPKILATVEVPSRKFACALETDLHSAMAPWQTTGEWYRYEGSDKSGFNDTWKMVFEKHAKPGWPLQWTKLAVQPMIKMAESRKRLYQHRWASRGQAYRDYLRASR